MSYNPFIKIEPKELAKLTFKCEFSNYLYTSESKGLQLGSLFETDKNTYDKISEVLQGNTGTSIKKKDRVYVLPGNNLPRPRIKEYLKSIGAYLTSDINKATVIAGNYHIEDSDCDQQAKIALMLFDTDNYPRVANNSDDDPDYITRFIDNAVQRIGGEQTRIDSRIALDVPDVQCIISNRANSEQLSYNNVVNFENKHKFYMYPLTVKVLYQILSNQIPVLTQDYFTENAHSSLNLSDPEVYGSINAMLTSRDETNIELGVEILVHAKIEDTPECRRHLWYLARDHNWELNSRRHDKNVKYFLNITDWEALSCIYGAYGYIRYAEEKDLLNSNIFNEMLPDIHREEENNGGTQFYELVAGEDTGYNTVCYTLADKWLKYLKKENDEKSIEKVQ